MRYLIFGDIHGNLPALEKLFHVERNNYDKMICHGDVVNYGPWSNECVDLLESASKITCLKGNHEEAFIMGAYPGKNELVEQFFQKCFTGFRKLDIIKLYHDKFEAGDYIVKHTINNKYYFPDTDLTEEGLDQNYIIGHSHYQFEKEHDKKRLINTGSIGQNRKFLNIAEYVILDSNTGEVELKQFETNVEDVLKEMKSQNYPQACLEYYQKKPLKV